MHKSYLPFLAKDSPGSYYPAAATPCRPRVLVPSFTCRTGASGRRRFPSYIRNVYSRKRLPLAVLVVRYLTMPEWLLQATTRSTSLVRKTSDTVVRLGDLDVIHYLWSRSPPRKIGNQNPKSKNPKYAARVEMPQERKRRVHNVARQRIFRPTRVKLP